jgi:ComF family protein
MLLTQTAHLLYDALLTVAFPQPCFICGQSVENRVLGVVCDKCWSMTRVFTGDESICWKCGVLSGAVGAPDNREQVRCRRCEAQPFTAARACGVYEGALRESVLLLKRQPNLSQHLLRLLTAAGKQPPLDVCTRIVAVPLHSERERLRGFNQASVIAQALAPSLRLAVDDVSLVRLAPSQKYRAGLDAKGRRDTVERAFAVRFPQLVSGESILLVDDVFTTGATVSSCALALLSAGARSVSVLTIARPWW